MCLAVVWENVISNGQNSQEVKSGERECRGRAGSASGIPQWVNQLSADEGMAFHRRDALVTQNQAVSSDLKPGQKTKTKSYKYFCT